MVLKKYSVFLMLLVLLLIIACSGGNGSADKAVPLSGQAIYTKYCTICHGDDGKKGLAGAKDLSQSLISREEREKVIRSGRKNMAGFQHILNDEEIKAVAGYLEELTKNK